MSTNNNWSFIDDEDEEEDDNEEDDDFDEEEMEDEISFENGWSLSDGVKKMWQMVNDVSVSLFRRKPQVRKDVAPEYWKSDAPSKIKKYMGWDLNDD